MRVNSNVISFFFLILAEKSRWGQHQFFQTYPIRTSFYKKCLISEKQCGFSLVQNHKSQTSTRHIEVGKFYTIIEFPFFSRSQSTWVTWTYCYTYMCTIRL